MKRNFKVMLSLLLVLAMTVPMSVSVFALSIQEEVSIELEMSEKMNSVFDNTEGMTLENVKEIQDFDGNLFYVVECLPTGYFIYNPTTDIVVESSQKGVSPYFDMDGDLYYGGPTYYYVLQNNTYTHTIDEEVLTESSVVLMQETCRSAFENLEATALARKNEVSTLAIADDDITVAHPEFYQNLTHCGYISGGRCGFIALGMLIAYKDKYEDDDLMSDNYWENDNILNSKNTSGLTVSADNVISQKLYELDPKDSTTSMHIHDVAKQYLSEVGKSANHTSRWKPFFTEGTVRNLIDAGNPVILFGSVPSNPTTVSTSSVIASSEGDSSNHAVVAYGYSADKTKFIVHYGWESSYYPDVKIDLGYFSLGSIYSFDLD